MTHIKLIVSLSLLTLLTACERRTNTTAPTTAPTSKNEAPTSLAVTVDATGYHPSSVSAPAGRPVRLTLTRTSDAGCGQQVVFPSLKIQRDLPLNRAVVVDFSMPASGSVAFTCGMDMLRGTIVAQ